MYNYNNYIDINNSAYYILYILFINFVQFYKPVQILHFEQN